MVPKVFKNKTSNLTLAAISDSDRPSSSTEKITLWFQGVNSTCSATVPYPTNGVN